MDLTFTILDRLEIIRKPGNAKARASLWQHVRLDCWLSMVQRNTRKELPV